MPRSRAPASSSGKNWFRTWAIVKGGHGETSLFFGVLDGQGEHLIEHEQQKKNIGERWEETRGGKVLFLWAVKKDEQGRDVRRQLQDKLAGS